MKKIITTFILSTIIFCVSAQKPIYDLVDRISPGASKQFLFELTDQESETDFFEIDQKGGKIWIKGNNNISIATGLNWYLKYHASIHISWNSPTAYLGKLPKVKTRERHSTDILVRYYLNYCTFSYTMAFWDWKRWEQEIDFMALHGINTPLSITGASTVWRNTLLKLGYTKEEAGKFIAGPAHQAWFLKGNLTGTGEPNPDSYYDNQEKLEKQIVERYKEFGIEPVFAGYSGIIPADASEKLGLKIKTQGKWRGYDRPALIDPEDPRFAQIAKVYYDEMTALYGVAKYYTIDPSFEGSSKDGIDFPKGGITLHHDVGEGQSPISQSLSPKVGLAMYDAMKQANADAVWVIQAWQHGPRYELISLVPEGKVLVLDSWSDSCPQWGDVQSPWYRKNGFEYHNWAYCMLLTFGGNDGMYGKMQRLIDGYYLARDSAFGKTLKAVGSTSEGIGTNPVMYELLFELPWRSDKFSKEDWLKTWTTARYGRTMPEIDEAWKTLSNTAYNAPYTSVQEGPTESVINSRPALVVESASSWGSSKMYYDEAEFFKAFTLMLKIADKFAYSDNFKYDLADIASQAISNRANNTLPRLLAAFDKGEKAEFERLSNIFLDMILLQDRLRGSQSETMVGSWIESAMRMGMNSAEQDFYRQSARRMITTWGDRDAANKGGMRDYAHREWNGLLRDYYYPRWKYFFDQINSSGVIPIGLDYYDMENAWVLDKTPYQHRPISDAIPMANEVYIFLTRNI